MATTEGSATGEHGLKVPASGLLERAHGGYVQGRRARVLAGHLATLIPDGARMLDVGCGDGHIDALIMERRPDVEIAGIDSVVRDVTHMTVEHFDARTIPFDDASMDVVMFVDVLHHADDPLALLREGDRVARDGLVLKDVTLSDPLARRMLTFMDWVGNARYDVPLPYNFWSPDEWADAFAKLGLLPAGRQERLGLYPKPANLLFERRMHFVTRLEPHG